MDFSDPITLKWYDTHSIQRVRTVKWCNVPALRVENQSLIERGDDYCCIRGDHLSRNLISFSGHLRFFLRKCSQRAPLGPQNLRKLNLLIFVSLVESVKMSDKSTDHHGLSFRTKYYSPYFSLKLWPLRPSRKSTSGARFEPQKV